MIDAKKMERLRQIIGDFAVNKGKLLLLLSFLLFIVAAYYVMLRRLEDRVYRMRLFGPYLGRSEGQ